LCEINACEINALGAMTSRAARQRAESGLPFARRIAQPSASLIPPPFVPGPFARVPDRGRGSYAAGRLRQPDLTLAAASTRLQGAALLTAP
jgi:hypothetical protein